MMMMTTAPQTTPRICCSLTPCPSLTLFLSFCFPLRRHGGLADAAERFQPRRSAGPSLLVRLHCVCLRVPLFCVFWLARCVRIFFFCFLLCFLRAMHM